MTSMLFPNQTTKQKFTIIVRLRPELKEDYKSYKPQQLSQSLAVLEDSKITLQRKNNEQKTFKFNWVLDPGLQKDIYEKSEHLVDSLFEGYNATFLAYGQTGTGKTHTVFGSDGQLKESGYFYNAVKDIFAKIKLKMHMRQFAVRVSFVEFYLDNIFDLISNENKRLDLKENGQNGIYIKDLSEIPVKSEEELFACVKQAIKMRKTQETSINKRSSRSHAVIQITLLQRWIDDGETKYLKAMLKVVDLAGSQRVSKTESNGNRLEQAKRINKQITTLGKCINMLAISEKQGKLINSQYDITNKFNFNKAYIPFRDAKITRFLSDSLEGRARIVLCVCVSKYLVHIEETFSSLLFASQASTLKIDSRRNEVYTLTPSVDKSANKFQTPTKAYNKGETKKSITPGKSSSTIVSQQQLKRSSMFREQSTDSVSNLTNLPTSSSSVKQQEQLKQSLLKKFRSQLQDINHYLKTKQIRNVEQTPANIMKENLAQMNKVFNLYRSVKGSDNGYKNGKDVE